MKEAKVTIYCAPTRDGHLFGAVTDTGKPFDGAPGMDGLAFVEWLEQRLQARAVYPAVVTQPPSTEEEAARWLLSRCEAAKVLARAALGLAALPSGQPAAWLPPPRLGEPAPPVTDRREEVRRAREAFKRRCMAEDARKAASFAGCRVALDTGAIGTLTGVRMDAKAGRLYYRVDVDGGGTEYRDLYAPAVFASPGGSCPDFTAARIRELEEELERLHELRRLGYRRPSDLRFVKRWEDAAEVYEYHTKLIKP